MSLGIINYIMDKNASTSVRNPLLQTASYGFPIDSLLSNNIIVPISKTESTFTGE